MERYSLEHVEGIRHESQRANGVAYKQKVDPSRQQLLMLCNTSKSVDHVRSR